MCNLAKTKCQKLPQRWHEPSTKTGVNRAERARNQVGSNLKGFLVLRPLHATGAKKPDWKVVPTRPSLERCPDTRLPIVRARSIDGWGKNSRSGLAENYNNKSIIIHVLLRTLHWLPIQARIEYKLSILCHSFFSDTVPVYLSDLLRVYSPSRQLRSSSDSRTLHIPHIKTKTFGHRSFSHAAPSVWNSLSHDIRHIQSVTAFKTALKTHLFKSYLC